MNIMKYDYFELLMFSICFRIPSVFGDISLKQSLRNIKFSPNL